MQKNRNYSLLVLALLLIAAIGAYGFFRKHRWFFSANLSQVAPSATWGAM